MSCSCIDDEALDALITASVDNQPTLEELTEGNLENGAGVFDVLMRAMQEHLEREHTAQRITGDQYASTYTQITVAIMQQSIAFLLGVGKLKQESNLASLQLCKIQKEIELLCQKLVTEKAQVMDQTILDPTADDDTSQEIFNDDGESFDPPRYLHDTVSEVVGTIGERNNVLARQVRGYDDNYKTNVGKSILDSYRTLLSNLGNDSGISFPPSLQEGGVDFIMKALKMDSGLQEHSDEDYLGKSLDSDDPDSYENTGDADDEAAQDPAFYYKEDPPEPSS